jgi:GNAT superfamily N-acetyltransferase
VTPTYRRARREEIPSAADVFLVSVAELAQSHGLPAPVGYTRASVLPLYEHLFDTGIFEVAEVDGKVIALAAGVVRDEIWFLSMFWVLPEHKLRGIGRPLLERVQRMAAEQGATQFCTWSSIDLTAVSMYLKLGMMPGGPIFTFAGPILHLPKPHPEARLSELDASQATAVDHVVRATPRAEDHAFWQARNVPRFLLESGDRTVGYFYCDNGVIGPAAWLREEEGPMLLASALTQAHAQTAQGPQGPHAKLIALGLNQVAIRAATAAGLRLVSASHFLRSGEVGQLEQYLPSGPGLF